MTTELNRLIGKAYAALEEETAARLRRKHDEIATQITKDTERLQKALTTYLGDAIVHALYQAEGKIEIWMHSLNERIAFTPHAWEDEGFPNIYVVLAFTYRGCRLHLMYRENYGPTAFDDPGEWTLSRVEPVIRAEPAQGNHNQVPEHPVYHRIFYPETRSMLATDRQRLLLMIDGLANSNEEPENHSEPLE